jgi:hypothetical protein
MRADLGLVDERIKVGITTQRSKAMDKHWGRWEEFCLAHHVDPHLSTWDDPVPMLQVFGERYRDGRLLPRNNPVKARASVQWDRRLPDWAPWTQGKMRMVA